LHGPSPLFQHCFPADFLVEARLLSRRRTVKAHLLQHARVVLLLHEQVELRLRLYEELTNSQPKPFDWRFTKADLADLLHRLAEKEQRPEAEPYSCFRP
jgi:hypothetical protein